MLNDLSVGLAQNLNQDCRVQYLGLPIFNVSIGINVWDWTLWTSITDLELDWGIISDKADDLDLTRAVPKN